MSNELTVTGAGAQDGGLPAQIFQSRLPTPFEGVNAGAVSIEQERAIAEAQGQLILAKRFPRSVAASTAEFLDACKSPDFSQAAFYTVPNRGHGPSIRFAEEAARCYGNFQYGHRELSRSEGKSEVEVYAWDMEKNNRSTRQITVMHVRDKQGGAAPLKDQTDIDNRVANVASKQMRGRILALLPKGMVEAGKAECKKTLAGDNTKPVSQRINDMTSVFGRLGVTPKILEAYLNHGLDDTTVDELADLHGIYNAIKEGAKPSEFFGADARSEDGAAEAIDKAARASKAAAPKAAEKPKEAAKAAPPAAEPEKIAAETPAEPAQQAQEPAQVAAATDEAQTQAEAQAPAPEPEPVEQAPAPEPEQQAAPAAAKEAVF